MSMVSNCLAGIGLFAGLLPVCRAQQPLPAAEAGVAAFLEQSASAQRKRLKQMHAAADQFEHAHFEALRQTARDVRREKRANKKSKLGKTKESKKPAPKAPATWQLPALVTYRYGLASIEPVLRSGGRRELQREQVRAPVELFLLGMLPDADLCVAELQARMDSDRSADAFMKFLEVWRNGDESFYEALDRTAGTKDSVFFYDVMLGDYVASFGKGKGESARRIASGLQAAHDALHESFLHYRQYRAFREAVALSLVMPPDVPLPKRLRRYETAAEGLYSLRDQVQMVLAVNEHDPRRVAELVRETAPPLPDPLWSAGYNPYEGWGKVFQKAMPAMIQRSGDTTKFLKTVQAEWVERAQGVRVRAREVLGLAGEGGTGE